MIYFEALFLENAVSKFVVEYHSVPSLMKVVSLVLIAFDIFLLFKLHKVVIGSQNDKMFIVNIVIIITFGILISDWAIALMAIFLLVGQFIKSENILSMLIYCLVISIMITLLLCAAGIFPNELTPRSVGDPTKRYTFGFYHSSKLPIAVMFTFLYIFISKNRKSVLLVACDLILTIVLYILCGSRNVLFISLLFLLMMAILKCFFNSKIGSCIRGLIKWSFVIMIVISFVALWLYMNRTSIGILMNIIFNNRLATPANYAITRGFNLINFMDYTKYMELQAYGKLQVDNSYFYLTIRYGIIALFIFSFLSVKMTKKAIKHKNIAEMSALFVLAIAMMIVGLVVSYGMFGIYVYFFNRLGHRELLENT